jgi:hypothetical protein
VHLHEAEFLIPVAPEHRDLISHVDQAMRFRLVDAGIPLRFVVTATDAEHYHCEIGVMAGVEATNHETPETDSIFQFVPRSGENTESFNAVLLVPTGIGAEIGGHAGDATPVARLLATACDRLVTHPNVVNASDLNEMPENALYVEGSVISRFMMGAVGLRPVRANRMLVVIDKHQDDLFRSAAINAVNAARASFGLDCSVIVELDPPVRMRTSYTKSGRATGEVTGLENLWEALEEHRGEYDAVALSSVINVPETYHQGYFDSQGEMVNPWGGVEAMLTHAVSGRFDVPSAHSPMFESREIANSDPGIVDPRMAAEAVSLAFFQCILKGLQRSPTIVTDHDQMQRPDVLTAANISCLVIPDGCLGLPTMAALEHGIPVIAVRENKNLMQNDLAALQWAPGQLHIVENYWEVVGVMNAIRAGIHPMSVRRPIMTTPVETKIKSADRETAPIPQEEIS